VIWHFQAQPSKCCGSCSRSGGRGGSLTFVLCCYGRSCFVMMQGGQHFSAHPIRQNAGFRFALPSLQPWDLDSGNLFRNDGFLSSYRSHAPARERCNRPSIGRSMIENSINNDQNNHRNTQLPVHKIFTHDLSPLYCQWLTFKPASKNMMHGSSDSTEEKGWCQCGNALRGCCCMAIIVLSPS
jgi:hypothetical protein